MRQKFFATIYKIGINPCVDVPAQVSRSFEKIGHIPVAGSLNGLPIRATLVPKGGGAHRMFINGEMRQRAGVGVGDRIDLVIEFDPEPRLLRMPEELSRSLEATPQAKAAFERLPPSHRNEILAYLNSLKRPETLQRNIGKVIDHLLKRDAGARKSG